MLDEMIAPFLFMVQGYANTADIYTGTRNFSQRLQKLKISIQPRPKLLQSQSQGREKEAVHTLSFRSAKPARWRENT